MTDSKIAFQDHSAFFIICLLGCLSVISPFAIDMYLPAYTRMADDFAVTSNIVALTISSYFIGLAGGQVLYGPLLDRFGRKRPVAVGLVIFVVASLGCAMAHNIYLIIGLRLVQALGGCVAQVASVAMVRDFFPVNQNAKILSLLFLFIAVSPFLAPSFGGFVALTWGWRFVFVVLAVIAATILTLVQKFLPEPHKPDTTISLRPWPILKEYVVILCHARFVTYALAGAFSFAGVFTYVAGSPIIFMEGFHLSAQIYSLIFAGIAVGFIGGSQVNVFLLRFFESRTLFLGVLVIQVLASLVFVLGAWMGWYGLWATLALFFICLCCAGLAYPNAAALAMSLFSKNAGSAAALLGLLQFGVGAIISAGLSASTSHSGLTVISILALTASAGLVTLMIGERRALTDHATDQD